MKITNTIKSSLILALGISTILACESKDKTNQQKSENLNTTHHHNIEVQDSVLKSFVPKGFHTIWKERADLNQDEIEDALLVLAPDNEVQASDFENGKVAKRIFLILTGKKEGGFDLKIESDKVIECIDCSGLNGDAFKGISIQKNGFDIRFEIMNEQYWKETKSFQYQADLDTWVLTQDYFINYKDNPAQGKANIGFEEKLSPTDFGQIKIEDFNIYATDRR